MNAFDYITAIQNANGPILNVSQSIGITINQINVMNNSFNRIDNSVHNFSEGIKESNNSFKQLEKTANNFDEGLKQSTASSGVFLSGLKALGAKMKQVFSPEMVLDFGKKVFEARVEYEKINGIKGGLSDQFKTLNTNWNNFLVSLGGESTGLFTGLISILNDGLTFLADHLPSITMWFKILWSNIEPVVTSLGNFFKSAFGFKDASDGIGVFGSVMQGVLFITGLFTTGLNTLIYWLTPFSDVIMAAAGAWALFNLIVAVSPIGWIVIGIMALITVIGLVIKYTSGWGSSFKFTTEGMKLLLEAFVLKVKADFNALINVLMISLEAIQRGWYKFKNAVGLGNKAENDKMISELNGNIEGRQKSIIDQYKAAGQKGKQAAEAFGIKFDTERLMEDVNSLGDMLKGAGKPTSLIPPKIGTGEGKNSKGTKANNASSADSIVSGGSKATNIIINIQKLQDDTKIYVDSSEKGISNLGEKVQEMLLRAVNSVNQMQTAG
jgi:hypothetical protein